MFPGHATAEGTARYRDRFPDLRDAGHFRRPGHVPGAGELWLSSIGLGTYLGEPDDAADQAYTEAIATALRSGINVIDTAINYRHQRSERNIGVALKQLIDSGELKRDEVIICTKAGYLSFDGNMPADPRGYFKREYLEPGILDSKQLAGGMHCMAPAYLENQIERSRHNLGLATIDLFYVHNPESQLADASREVFHQRLKDAFAMLEGQVKAGRLGYYGVATWNASVWLRVRTTISISSKSRNWRARRVATATISVLSSFRSIWPCPKPMAYSIRAWEKRRCLCSPPLPASGLPS